MMRTQTKLVLALVAILLTGILSYFGAIYLTEWHRIRDAEAAFRPILHLRCVIWSQPIALRRYCRYIVEFPPNSELSDAKVAELQVLNRLPPENTLDVVIQTPQLTDRALPHLKTLKTLDLLDVTDTAISDRGIEELRQSLPQADVLRRRTDQPSPKR